MASAKILKELELEQRFANDLAVLLRPRQFKDADHEEIQQALEAFDKMNKETVAKFFGVKAFRVLFL